MIRPYIQLSKPGIIMGNTFAGIGGFLYASYGINGTVALSLMVATIVGLVCIIASACTYNNIIDQDIDSLMSRTQRRVLVTGHMPPMHALAYGTVIGMVGFALLHYYSSPMALHVGIFAWVAYVIIYSKWGKRTRYGTFWGSFSGAVPPVLGYVAVSNTIDPIAGLLFALYAVWQMPHSYAIAVFRADDYTSAKIPVLPLVVGFGTARFIMAWHIFVFTAIMAYFGWLHLHHASLFLLIALCLWWLFTCLFKYTAQTPEPWGRKVFYGSLYVIVAFNTLLMVDHLLRQYVPMGF